MTDIITYPAIFEYADGVIGVRFPDLLGCVTSATDEAAAVREAREAMLLHLEGMIDDGDDLPAPSAARAVATGKNELVFLIDAPRPDLPARVNFSTQASKLALIDRLAAEHGMTRSAWMVMRSTCVDVPPREAATPNARKTTVAKKSRAGGSHQYKSSL